MSKPPPSGPNFDAPLDALTEQALEKLVHLHSGAETAADWAAYEDWKAASAENRLAADRAETLWQKLGPALARPQRSKPKSIPIILVLLLAGLAAMLVGSGWFGPPRYLFADQKTAVGEHKEIVLADGSKVEVDSDTAFDIDVSQSKRELTLFTGQIFVTVTPDKARPFTVRAGDGVARALGTAFGVRQDRDGTQVVVTESTVRVSGAASGRSVDVHAGQQVDYSPQRGLGEPKRADLRVLTAWRSGQMIFEGRPLGDVVAEMSRYRWGTIVFADASLKQLLVTGIFDTNDTDGLLNAIATVLPVKIDRVPGVTLIRRDTSRAVR
jgi:transmembrane sensor